MDYCRACPENKTKQTSPVIDVRTDKDLYEDEFFMRRSQLAPRIIYRSITPTNKGHCTQKRRILERFLPLSDN